MQPIPFAAGEHPHLLLLIGPLEPEPGAVGAAVDAPPVEIEYVEAAGDLLERVLVRVQIRAALVDVAHLHGLPDHELPAVGLLLAGDHPEQGGLAGAVGADHAHDPALRERKVELLHQQPVTEPLHQVLGNDDLVAQPGRGGDQDLVAPIVGGLFLGQQLLVGVESRLALRLARPGREPHPLELAGEVLLAGRLALLFIGQPVPLLLEPAGIVPLPGDPGAAVELEDPPRDVVEEVPVVRDRDDRARKVGQVALQPLHRLGVEVVGRFVEEQHVGLLEQETAEGHAAFFAARELVDRRVARGAAQGVHRDVDLAVELPEPEVLDLLLEGALLVHQLGHLVVRHRLGELGADRLEVGQHLPLGADRQVDVPADVERGVETRFLWEVADLEPVHRTGLTLVLVVDARHDLDE